MNLSRARSAPTTPEMQLVRLFYPTCLHSIRDIPLCFMAPTLSPDRALVFRITHIANVPWMLRNGLHCQSSNCLDPHFINIGNPELIDKRATRTVPVSPFGSLSDYIPFYFTPFSPMLLNIVTGYQGVRQFLNSEIVFLVSSIHKLAEAEIATIFTDRHAYLRIANFYSSLEDLDKVDWQLLQSRDFRRDPDDPDKFARYEAEALVHKHLQIEELLGIACFGEDEKRTLIQHAVDTGTEMRIVSRPSWYFRR